MSYMERHTGKLVPVNKNEDQEKVAFDILKTKFNDVEVLNDYDLYGNYLSYLMQEFGDEYFLYNGIIYANENHIE